MKRLMAVTVTASTMRTGGTAEQVAWVELCAHIYSQGLRIVPPSEGGQLPAWVVEGDQWSTVVVVDELGDRLERLRVQPLHEISALRAEALNRVLEGQRLTDIAEALGVPHSTLTTWAHRQRKADAR